MTFSRQTVGVADNLDVFSSCIYFRQHIFMCREELSLKIIKNEDRDAKLIMHMDSISPLQSYKMFYLFSPLIIILRKNNLSLEFSAHLNLIVSLILVF